MNEKVKQHFAKHKTTYIVVGAVVIAGITWAIVRQNSSPLISRGTSVTADRGISVIGKKVVMNNVSYISADRPGPPSWVVRCVETGDIFSSQNQAAINLEVPASELSKHLNGLMDDVRGLHFERICLAA